MEGHRSLQEFNKVRKEEDADECPSLLSQKVVDRFDEFAATDIVVWVVDLAQYEFHPVLGRLLLRSSSRIADGEPAVDIFAPAALPMSTCTLEEVEFLGLQLLTMTLENPTDAIEVLRRLIHPQRAEEDTESVERVLVEVCGCFHRPTDIIPLHPGAVGDTFSYNSGSTKPIHVPVEGLEAFAVAGG